MKKKQILNSSQQLLAKTNTDETNERSTNNDAIESLGMEWNEGMVEWNAMAERKLELKTSQMMNG